MPHNCGFLRPQIGHNIYTLSSSIKLFARQVFRKESCWYRDSWQGNGDLSGFNGLNMTFGAYFTYRLGQWICWNTVHPWISPGMERCAQCEEVLRSGIWLMISLIWLQFEVWHFFDDVCIFISESENVLDEFDLYKFYDSRDQKPSPPSPLLHRGRSFTPSSHDRGLDFPGSDDDSDAPRTLTASARK